MSTTYHVMRSEVHDRIVAAAFVGLSIVSVIGSYWAQRRSGKLSARAERRLYKAHLEERQVQLEAVTVRQREVDERLYPDAARLAGLVAHRRYLWERRPTDADFLAFRLGRSTVPLHCAVELALTDDPLTEYQPELYEQATALVARYQTVDDLSVVNSLGQASAPGAVPATAGTFCSRKPASRDSSGCSGRACC